MRDFKKLPSSAALPVQGALPEFPLSQVSIADGVIRHEGIAVHMDGQGGGQAVKQQGGYGTLKAAGGGLA